MSKILGLNRISGNSEIVEDFFDDGAEIVAGIFVEINGVNQIQISADGSDAIGVATPKKQILATELQNNCRSVVRKSENISVQLLAGETVLENESVPVYVAIDGSGKATTISTGFQPVGRTVSASGDDYEDGLGNENILGVDIILDIPVTLEIPTTPAP